MTEQIDITTKVTKIVIYNEYGQRETCSVTSEGIITFADNLTLDEAKDALKFALEALARKELGL